MLTCNILRKSHLFQKVVSLLSFYKTKHRRKQPECFLHLKKLTAGAQLGQEQVIHKYLCTRGSNIFLGTSRKSLAPFARRKMESFHPNMVTFFTYTASRSALLSDNVKIRSQLTQKLHSFMYRTRTYCVDCNLSLYQQHTILSITVHVIIFLNSGQNRRVTTPLLQR